MPRFKNVAPEPMTLLTPEERAYIAGLIDGEGTIYAAATGPYRNKTVYPHVCIGMTYKPVIDWLAKKLGMGRINAPHNTTNLRRHSYMRPQYLVRICGRRAMLLCDIILPYLRVKRGQAELVLQFPPDQRIAPGKLLKADVKARRLELREAISKLNGRDNRMVTGARRKQFIAGIRPPQILASRKAR